MASESSLTKIPFILAVSLACHATWNPPVPVEVAKDERVAAREWGEWTVRLTFRLMPANPLSVVKGNWWAIGLLEIITIILQNFGRDLLAHYSNYALSQSLGSTQLYVTSRSMIGLILVLLGASIRWSCYRALASQFTFVHTMRKNHKLITGGPYSVVRHPSYTGMILVYIGLTLWHGSPGSWLLESGILGTTGGYFYALAFGIFMTVGLAALLSRMFKEDQYLKETFGKEWEMYAARAPYRLVPRIL